MTSEPAHVHVLVFSKDRPFQLREALRSLAARCATRAVARLSCAVLYCASSPAYGAAYASVRSACPRLIPSLSIDWVCESDFGAQLVALVEATASTRHACVLTLVDDALWVADFDLHGAAAALCDHPDLLAVTARMHAGVVYSFTADVVSEPPSGLVALPRHTAATARALLAWNLGAARSSAEWGCAFELSATLYRARDLAAALRFVGATDARALSQPNLLEAALSRAWWARAGGLPAALASLRRAEGAWGLPTSPAAAAAATPFADGSRWWLACPPRPTAVVLTVNVVQSVFLSRVHVGGVGVGGGGGGGGGGALGAPALIALVDVSPNDSEPTACALTSAVPRVAFDLRWYAERARLTPWPCVHIGDWRVAAQDAARLPLAVPPQGDDDAEGGEAGGAAPVAVSGGAAGDTCRVVGESCCEAVGRHVANTLAGGGDLAIATVSVVMPARNAARHLPAALASIARQTHPDIELVVVDDASDDGGATAAIIAAHAAEHAAVTGDDALASNGAPHRLRRYRVVVVRLATQGGVAAALNVGLRHCTGALIARMDADDVAAPERLALQAEFMAAHAGVDVVGAAVQLVAADDAGGGGEPTAVDESSRAGAGAGEDGGRVGGGSGAGGAPAQLTSALPASPHPPSPPLPGGCTRVVVLPTHPVLTAWRMLFGCALAHPTVMARRDFFARAAAAVGGRDCAASAGGHPHPYPLGFPHAEDYALWCSALFAGGGGVGAPTAAAAAGEAGLAGPARPPQVVVCSLPAPLLCLRRHAQSASRMHAAHQRESALLALHAALCDPAGGLLARAAAAAAVPVSFRDAPVGKQRFLLALATRSELAAEIMARAAARCAGGGSDEDPLPSIDAPVALTPLLVEAAVDLLETLEAAFVTLVLPATLARMAAPVAPDSESAATGGHENGGRGISSGGALFAEVPASALVVAIQSDVSARVGALVTTAIAVCGPAAAPLLARWRRRPAGGRIEAPGSYHPSRGAAAATAGSAATTTAPATS